MREIDKTTSKPKPPLAGVVYGEIAYWVVLIGTIISLIGVMMILTTDSNYIDSNCLLSGLWGKEKPSEIWEKCAGGHPEGHWYLSRLSTGDGIAMLGIALSCLAAVIGVWASSFAMLRDKEILFFIFALVTAIILTASATGIINAGH
ncbi:hypothetical protein Asulf_00336 [Archaeoglobus sulfaticallidus PM70-1]|uniref:DUF1634 domain-containing protein n=1 Tax=Archaeoglobus sulfaticallidus PM70-1 TaxID=387631 RepID=N0BBI2_9EURY|nr:DUF1634 domain-containing protein [Archaeoglobus sulfaticallidus]AGK60368.1 hypothetical protein Asulf_00336 [Archaeoglobus sulfaticallidus PM70-1]